MKRTIVVAVTAIAVMGLSNPVRAEGTVNASVDCATFHFDVAGYPDGTNVFVEIGSEPPRGFAVGGYAGGFSPVPGGATGTLDIPLYWTTQKFGATIDMTIEGNNVRAFDQEVDCSPHADAEPVAEAEVGTAAADTAIWTTVELAPPW